MKLKLAALALAVAGVGVSAPAISIQLEGDAFKVAGWKAPSSVPARGWSSVLAVYAGVGDVPPLLGAYAVEAGTLVFHPRFPFEPGVRYRAVFLPPGGGAAVERIFDGPAKPTASTARVESVYPSAHILPSNQLRLFIYFSAPMSRGEAAARIHILDNNGKAVPAVFLPGEELWDQSGRRLTMTFDPGRIKRGLTSNQTMGPPITEGRSYTLTIDREWRDARGVSMAEGFRKVFRAGPAERNPPDPKQWRVTAPQAGTTAALSVTFPDPMSFPLLQRMLEVKGPRAIIAGTVSIERQETEWRFTPREPWQAGAYRLVVDTAIEDLAGDHIGQAFDIDVFEHVTERIEAKTISLPFAVQ